MLGMLAESFAGLVHRPEVHGAVAIGGEVNTAAPIHRVRTGSSIVGGEGNSFRTGAPFPEGLGLAAFISLGNAGVLRAAGEEDRVAVVAIDTLERLVEGNPLNVIFGVDGD